MIIMVPPLPPFVSLSVEHTVWHIIVRGAERRYETRNMAAPRRSFLIINVVTMATVSITPGVAYNTAYMEHGAHGLNGI